MSEHLIAKELKEHASIVDLLKRLGFNPVKKSGKEHLYISMLREFDTKPSFCVNDDVGVWFDHGIRKGGNIIDFGLAYWRTLSFNEVVEKLVAICAANLPERQSRPRRPGNAVKLPHYIIEAVKDVGTHPAITSYLKSRGVFDLAKKLLNEVYYYVEVQKGERKHFYAAGWKNESDGWEVRNKYFKGCLGKKAISVIQGHPKEVAVFEGFINYLSWNAENPEAVSSIIVLNTLALLSEGIEKAKEFSSINLFLDRDNAGHQATATFIKALPYASDRSKAYEGFNDYNDKLVAALTANAVIASDTVQAKKGGAV